MRLRCPCCGATNSLDALIAHDDARAAIKTALELDAGLGNLVYQYLGLFRPAKNALGWDKVASVLGTLNVMIASAQVSANGITYAAPRALWQEAIRTALDKRTSLKLPLANHHYLMAIVAGMAEQLGRKGEATRDMARGGNTPVAAGAHARPEMTRLPDLPPRKGVPEEFRNIFKSLKKGSSDVSTATDTATNPAAAVNPGTEPGADPAR